MTDPTPETTPTRDEAVRSFWETQREISHQEADEAAIRLINSHFKNDAERARVSIPANPDRDDDLIIRSYIRQQMRLASAPAPASGGVDAVANLLRKLEEACDAAASKRSQATYDQMISDPGAEDALDDLDAARREARAFLNSDLWRRANGQR